jgi:hypothetical protein
VSALGLVVSSEGFADRCHMCVLIGMPSAGWMECGSPLIGDSCSVSKCFVSRECVCVTLRLVWVKHSALVDAWHVLRGLWRLVLMTSSVLVMADHGLSLGCASDSLRIPLLGRLAPASRVCAAICCSTPRRCVGSSPMLFLVQALGTSWYRVC